MSHWHLFQGNGKREKGVEQKLLNIEPPPWRKFEDKTEIKVNEKGIDLRWLELRKLAQLQTKGLERGRNFRLPQQQKEAQNVINSVNAAIYLRRPLLVTGKPGSGKTSLAYAIAYELGLGTAFLPSHFPRVLLIDEIDKSDINLPNDLLNIFEEGEFIIPELMRRTNPENQEESLQQFTVWTQDEDKVILKTGKVKCYAFPIIVMTSNGERDFPPAFKRRCLRVTMPDPKEEALKSIVKAHFGDNLYNEKQDKIVELIQDFLPNEKEGEAFDRATDQLLNTIHILTYSDSPKDKNTIESIKEILLKSLSE